MQDLQDIVVHDSRFGLQIVNPKPDYAEYCWQLQFLTAVKYSSVLFEIVSSVALRFQLFITSIW